MAEKKKLKATITDIHEGVCEKCDEPVIGFEVKLENFSGLLCADCLKQKWSRRQEMLDSRPLLKEADGGRKSA